MSEHDWLVEKFEAHRAHLRSVAYRMLGSLSDADDAVQEAWLRVSRADTSGVENLRAWLTTVVARICLNLLQSRKSRREEPLEAHVPDPIISRAEGSDPEGEAILADSVGLALLVVLESLTPAERLAFVLHDIFALPFEEIATVVDRSPAATRQLASRARRRVQSATLPDPDLARQRQVVDAFLAAARAGDFQALLALLDPDAVVRADGGELVPSLVIKGASRVAGQALAGARRGLSGLHVLVNGAAGIVSWDPEGRPFAVMGFTIVEGKIKEIDILMDPERLARLDLAAFQQ